MHGIGVGVDGKRGEIGMLPAVLVHVAPHDQRVQADERNAHIHFVIGIRSGGERGSDFVRDAVGHFFDADHDGRFQFPGGDRHQPGAEGSRTRSAGRLHFDGVPAAQAGPVRHQRAEVVLAVDDARHHVADENALGGLAPGVVQGADDRLGGDVADGFFPLFVDDGLSDAEDGDWSHKKPSILSNTKDTKEHEVPQRTFVLFGRWILTEDAIRGYQDENDKTKNVSETVSIRH